MISRLKSPRRLRLFVFGALLSLTVYAAATVELAGLKLNGHPIPRLGRGHCKSSDEVEIVLSPKIRNEHSSYRYLFMKVKDDEKNKTKTAQNYCSKNIKRDEKTGTFTNDDSKISLTEPGYEFIPKSACSNKGERGARVICIYESADSEGDLLAWADFAYETRIAVYEKVQNVVAVNGEIKFEVVTAGVSSDVEIEVCYTSDANAAAPADECIKPFKIEKFKKPEITLSSLEDKEYRVFVRLNQGGEKSKWNLAVTERPVPAAYPFDTYMGSGGDIQFGCSQSNGSSSFIFLFAAFLALLLVRLRKQDAIKGAQFFLVASTFFMLTTAKESHAEIGQMNIGILGAMYRPDLDSETSVTGGKIFPFYKCFFARNTNDANGRINPLMGVEFDWHLFDGFGSIQLGFGLGYTFAKGKAVELNGNTPDCSSPIENASVTLHMFQLRPQLTYLFNPYEEYVPLVPYVRAGLIAHGYSFFESGKNGRTVEPAEGITVKPNGIRFGYQAAVGLMLMLDFLEPSAVTQASGSGLFNHVYLKSELSLTKIDGFGRRGFQFSSKDVMGTNWPLMWTFGLVFELP